MARTASIFAAVLLTLPACSLAVSPKPAMAQQVSPSPGPVLSAGRWAATATLLPDGRVLVAGGYAYAAKNTLRTADILDPATGKSRPAATLIHDRNFAVSYPLPDGTVLVAGGYSEHCGSLDLAEIYDPRANSWRETNGFLTENRELFTLTPLADGTLLLAGGLSLPRRHTLADAEVYDPKTGLFTAVAGPMKDDRFGQAAVRLSDGRVLIAGGKSWKIGQSDRTLASAEIYDPKTRTFAPANGAMRLPRDRPTASLLPDGTVLIAGGSNAAGTPATCEIWDPKTGLFHDGPTLNEGRMAHEARTLPDGRIVVAGGWSETRKSTTSTVEIYDPVAGNWTKLPDLPFAAHDLCLVVLPGGMRLLAAGGKASTGDEKTASSIAGSAYINVPLAAPAIAKAAR